MVDYLTVDCMCRRTGGTFVEAQVCMWGVHTTLWMHSHWRKTAHKMNNKKSVLATYHTLSSCYFPLAMEQFYPSDLSCLYPICLLIWNYLNNKRQRKQKNFFRYWWFFCRRVAIVYPYCVGDLYPLAFVSLIVNCTTVGLQQEKAALSRVVNFFFLTLSFCFPQWVWNFFLPPKESNFHLKQSCELTRESVFIYSRNCRTWNMEKGGWQSKVNTQGTV